MTAIKICGMRSAAHAVAAAAAGADMIGFIFAPARRRVSIAEAQEILCTKHGVSKEEAYHVIREQAMQKRVTAEEIARSIINANEILSVKKPRS